LTPVNGIKHYHIDIYAMSEDQAKASFDDVYNMLETHKVKMQKYFTWTKEVITNLKTKSMLRFRSSNSKTKDGGRPGKVDYDEVHAFENYKLIEVSETGLGKKKYPRKTIISTDGDVRDGPLDDYKETGWAILKGEEKDNGFLPFMCRLEKEEEIHIESKWTKANPSLIYFPTLRKQLEAEYQEFKKNNVSHASFATKRMNLPFGQKEIEVTDWKNIKATNKDLPDLSGWRCTVGIDYVKVTDFASVDFHFRNGDLRYDINHSWLCLKSNDLSRIKAPWREWAAAGKLTLVDDVEISPNLITDYIVENGARYSIQKIALDNFRYALLKEALKKIGFDAAENKNVKLVQPSDIMKVVPIIDRCFSQHYFIWGDNPPLRWGTNNTKLVRSSKKIGSDTGNYYYAKIEGKSRKTDPFMAVAAAMVIEDELGDGTVIVPDMPVYTY
jgi:phage terminase large subunit-like protein